MAKNTSAISGINSDSSLLGKEPEKKDAESTFNQTQKDEIWAQQNGKCASCHRPLDPKSTEYDHIKAWAGIGKTVTQNNGAALCANCHKVNAYRDRSSKVDNRRNSKERSFGFGNLKQPKGGV